MRCCRSRRSGILTDSVADWCRTPIDLGPGATLTPSVVGPASVPVIDDVKTAERDPELAVLSVLVVSARSATTRMAGRRQVCSVPPRSFVLLL